MADETYTEQQPEVQAVEDEVVESTASPGASSAEGATVSQESPVAKNAPIAPQTRLQRFKSALRAWWRNPKKRYITIGSILGLLLLLAIVPATRAFLLNVVGVRTRVIVTVVDKGTALPMERAVVSVAGKTAKTDEAGRVELKRVRLGAQKLSVEKPGFAPYHKKVYLGVRVTDFGDVSLRPVGAQLSYVVTDFLSGKPIKDAEFISGQATTKSDEKGKALLTLESSQATGASVSVEAKGYRTEKLAAQQNAKATTALKLVPSAKAVYVSKKSGRYDVYKKYIDGKNEQVLLLGTGLENQSMRALVSPENTYVAVVSSREEKRNSQGYLLSTLTLVDIASGEAQTVAQAEQMTLLGWVDQMIVFQETSVGASAANPNRQKIFSYNTVTGDKKQLASANYFNDYLVQGKDIYYTVSATDAAARETFVKVGADGTNRKPHYASDVWSLIRVDYKNFRLQTPAKWFNFNTDTVKLAESVPPNELSSRVYTDSQDGARSAWIDQRDNTGVVTMYEVGSGTDRQIASIKNAQGIVGWLNEQVLIVRVANYSEVADYAVSLQGGAPVKVADVSGTPLR